MKPYVLYHSPCLDGFTAAWCASRRFGDDGATYIGVNYGQPPPIIAGGDVYILDFSYKKDVLLEMAEQAASIVVLDHHKTAQEDLAFFANITQIGAKIQCRFDMKKSGARLAHEYFFPGEPSNWLVDYTEDRDLWRHKLNFTEQVNACLQSVEPSFARWDDLLKFSYPGTGEFTQIVMEGQAILRFKETKVASICKMARLITLAGCEVLAVNTSCFHSEVAGKLAEGKAFGIAWHMDDGMIRVSLRSTDEGADVGQIARSFGGGGHLHAAGFELKARDLYLLIG